MEERATITLLIPIAEAIEWDVDALNEKLGRAADKAGGEFVDDSESEDDWEVFEFSGLSADQVRDLAARTLPKRGVADVTISGEDEVTVSAKSAPWLRALGPAEHSYDRAMKRLCKKLAEDPAWTTWWASTGHRRLEFHQSHQSPDEPPVHPWIFRSGPMGDLPTGTLLVWARVDLELLSRSVASSEATEKARANLAIILDKTAQHVGRGHPPLTV